MIPAKLSQVFRSPIFFGLVAGALAVTLQQLLMPGRDAYGLCTVCHTRDLMAWLVAAAGEAERFRAFVGEGLPVFTTLGITIGALASAWRHGEFRWVRASRPVLMAGLGLIVGFAGLVVMSCPTRLFLRLSYADPFTVPALAGLFAGIAAGVAVLRRL